MPFLPTSQCPEYAYPSLQNTLPVSCPHFTTSEIDQVLLEMMRKGVGVGSIPSTQFGRRCAVAAYLAYERVEPLER